MDRHQPPDQGSADATVGEAWRDHRHYLLDAAYRMLGSVNEAEDIVQEAFAHLPHAVPPDLAPQQHTANCESAQRADYGEPLRRVAHLEGTLTHLEPSP